MKKLIEMGLFSLVKRSKKAKVAQTELESAYEEFAMVVQQCESDETDLSSAYYKLGYTLIEIIQLGSGMEKKYSI